MTTATLRTERATRSARGKARGRSSSFALGLTGIVAFLAVWELLPLLRIVDPQFVPPASRVVVTLFGLLGEPGFWSALGDTMLSWSLGLLIAIVSALVVGIIIGSSRFLTLATHSTIEFFRPIPSVALIPIAVLLFGVGIGSSLLLVVYACFWQVLIQVLYGVADVDPVADETARSYRFSTVMRVRYVIWPTLLPYLLTGVRLASAIALILALTGELVIGTPGIGSLIGLTQTAGRVDEMYALILFTGLLGVAINIVFRAIERMSLSWHASARAEVIL